MRQPTRTFTLEFKQEAVQLLETSGKSGTMLAKELGISESVLYRWRKELRTQGAVAFPGKGHQTELEEEVRRLRRENATLQQERDILKKAAAIFFATPTVRYDFIAQHQEEFPVKVMCRVLDVAENGYFAWRQRQPSARQYADEQLCQHIHQVF